MDCKYLKVYRTKKAAEADVKAIRERGGGLWSTYLCKLCRKFHIGPFGRRVG